MRAHRRRSSRIRSVRHSSTEQVALLAQFEEERGKGRSAAEAAKTVGASLPSIYRWRRSHHPYEGLPAATPAQKLNIDAAIARLADDGNHDRLSFLEALFKFAAWLRWPTRPGDHPAATTAYVVSYLAKGHSTETLDQLSDANRDLILRNVQVDTLKRMFSSEALVGPSFDLWPIRGQKYNELDFLAQVAWFMIAYEPLSNHPRDIASLNKAYLATQEGIFGFRWPMVRSTFRNFWLSYGPAAPFHYVERYHPSFDFTLSPLDATFADSVDEIIERPDVLRRHLGRCRSAVELIRTKLDQRALQRLNFPNFPPFLPVEPILPPPLPDAIKPVMQMAVRGDKRKRHR
ncbi:hypothetical protein [Methylobacterium tardum]|uniref:hypothetical protein n=1 Tax=Methylobacterium tardum TaxID=374432 RepID=UPI001EE0096D|nr:hypothetical protein [Methylobacterium tardum]URD34572.1 hypothetical protein M6G65_18405 [Methylobacterium tardum]